MLLRAAAIVALTLAGSGCAVEWTREHELYCRMDETLAIRDTLSFDRGAIDDALLDGREPATAEAVRADLAQAQAYNIRGVPAFIFGNRYYVSGAQPLELLERAADAARAEAVAVH